MSAPLLFCPVGGEILPRRLQRGCEVIRLPLVEGRRRPGFLTDSETLAKALSGGWDDAARDLHNVTCALRAAGLYFGPGAVLEPGRVIRLVVGVRNVALWRELTPRLRQVVHILGGDTLDFHPVRALVPRTVATGEPQIFGPGPAAPDCVCLFSGGADSFAGAALLLRLGRRPILVSHAAGPIAGRQGTLWQGLRAVFPDLPDDWLLQVRAQRHQLGRKTEKSKDPLQRLRVMSFLSVAAIVARAVGVRDIFLCENGLVGAAISFAAQDDFYKTKPAEPGFLREMQGLLHAALGDRQLRVRNPFQFQTKGEVLAGVVEPPLRELLPQTVSCWAAGNHGVKNCGQCVPCLFRQLAFDEARLGTGLPANATAIPAGTGWSTWKSPHLSRLHGMLAYGRKAAREGGERWLRTDEPAVYEAVDVTGGEVRPDAAAPDFAALDDAAPEKFAGTVRRFAAHLVGRLPT